MLRSFLRLLSSSSSSADERSDDHSFEDEPTAEIQYARIDRSSYRQGAIINHRAWLLGMQLEHTRLCSPKRCDRFAMAGVFTAGDLAVADPIELAVKMGLPIKASNTLKRYRRAIRFATEIAGLMPRDALLLTGIHRASARAIALDSPQAILRDLERFVLSSRGQRLLGNRRLPSMRRIKAWVTFCQDLERVNLERAKREQVDPQVLPNVNVMAEPKAA